MTYMELINHIRDLGLPCAYGSFATPPDLPYAIVVYAYDSDLQADNQNYAEVGNYQLELYHSIKHPPSENLIQDKLKELRLPYRKTETFIDSEKLYQIVYDIKLIGG